LCSEHFHEFDTVNAVTAIHRLGRYNFQLRNGGCVLSSLVEWCGGTLPEFRIQQLANTVWAFARIAVDNVPLQAAISAPSISRIDEMEAQECANIAWAFAKLNIADVPLFDALSSASIPKIADFIP